MNSLPAKQSIPFARATITMTKITTMMTMITIIPTVNEFESAAEKEIFALKTGIHPIDTYIYSLERKVLYV